MAILEFLESEMERPGNYGWFHIMFLCIVALATTLLIIFFRDCKEKTFRRILFIGWLIITLFEIYKQIVFTFKISDGTIKADYQWYAFPFQFCSSPLYVLPFVVFLKDGKVRDAFMAFVSSFVLFAGVAVMLYPNDVFIDTIGINIQTMVHHGMQVVLGIFTAVYNRKRLYFDFMWKAIFVFAVMSLIAVTLNEVMYAVLQGSETFNMFYISRHYPCTLPILSMFYGDVNNPLLPYPLFLVLYLVGFAFVSFIIYTIEWLTIVKTTNKNAKFLKA